MEWVENGVLNSSSPSSQEELCARTLKMPLCYVKTYKHEWIKYKKKKEKYAFFSVELCWHSLQD